MLIHLNHHQHHRIPVGPPADCLPGKQVSGWCRIWSSVICACLHLSVDHILIESQEAAGEAGKIISCTCTVSTGTTQGYVLSLLPSTPMTTPQEICVFNSWNQQTTQHSSASSKAERSLYTVRRLNSWPGGAVTTTWTFLGSTNQSNINAVIKKDPAEDLLSLLNLPQELLI